MAAFEWWNEDDTVLLAPASEGGIGFTFNDVIGGTPTAVQEFHFRNNSGQDEEGLTIQILCRKTNLDQFVSQDEEFVENKYLQARIKGTSAWQSMGPGSELLIDELLDGEQSEIEVRIVSLDSTQVASYQVKFRVNRKPYIELGSGFFETVGNGVVSGLGDATRSFLMNFSNVLENPGGADDSVLVPKILGSILGIGSALQEDLVSIGTTDFNGDTPVSAEKFISSLVFDGSSIVVTKGIKDNDPVKPTPSDGFLLAWVTQDASGNIEDADIENVWYLDRFEATESILDITIHRGIGHVDNHLVYHNKSSQFSLTDDSTNYVFLRKDRNFTINTTGENEQGRDLLLYEYDTVAGAIVAKRDRRPFIGIEIEKIDIKLSGSPLVVSSKDYGHYASNRIGYITKIVVNCIGGTGTGGTKVDINKSTNGVAFSSIFGDQDLRPFIAGGEEYDINAFPTDVKIDMNSRFEVEVDEVPGTTSPTVLLVTLFVEIP